MLKVSIYVEGQELELFKDEQIEINSSVQNIADISKTFSDFSQSFTVPASNKNNDIFKHYYNTDVDGTFNPNIRVLGYIELGSLPYRYGLIQLEDVKIKDQRAYAYSIRFFSSTLNLSDLVKEDELGVLDLSAYDHNFNETIFDATQNPTIADGNVYYPLISSVRNMVVGDASVNDITNVSGELKYYELKPALNLNRIFDAIQTYYGVTFKRDFLNRAVFDNLFMWLHKDAGQIEAFGTETQIDITSAGTIEDTGATVSTVNNTISFTCSTNPYIFYRVFLKIIPNAGFQNVPYKINIYNETEVILEGTGTGTRTFNFNGQDNNTYVCSFTIQSSRDFSFQSLIIIKKVEYVVVPGPGFIIIEGSTTTSTQTSTALIKIAELMPKFKVRDFLTSIIKMFNLVLVPINSTTFTLLPLDDWYAKGKLIDISDFIDTSDVVIKRPKLFKQIDFKHQNTGQILGEQFRENNGGIGYGDLRARYDIDGTDLKVETQFENLVFERLNDLSDGDLTNIQVGKSIDKTLAPYIGKPFIFYRNGYTFYDIPIKADGHADLDYTWQTATENDLFISQVSNSVNFSTDISTFLYSEIPRNLYSNYWQDYISDLYSLKRRISTYTAYLPIGVLINLNLNDRLKIGDRAYVINSMKINLVSGKVDFELLNYIGVPFTSVNDNIMLTADTVDYFADSTLLTADLISLYVPAYSAVNNGVEFTSLLVTPSAQNYDCKITANQNYLATKISTGDGTSWITLENASGTSTNYMKINVANYSAGVASDTAFRTMDINVVIGAETFTITVIQGQL